MPYLINLEVFEGPVDLLLWLVETNNMDIYDIEISKITSQYLEYISSAGINLNETGEFLQMASRLVRIKSRLLLPKESEEYQEAMEEKLELQETLKEWKKIKESRQFLLQKYSERKNIFFRSEPAPIQVDKKAILTVFDLIDFFRKIVKKKSYIETVLGPEIYLEDVIDELSKKIASDKKVRFFDIAEKNLQKLYIAVLLAAALELSKRREISLRQREQFGDIVMEAKNAA